MGLSFDINWPGVVRRNVEKAISGHVPKGTRVHLSRCKELSGSHIKTQMCLIKYLENYYLNKYAFVHVVSLNMFRGT